MKMEKKKLESLKERVYQLMVEYPKTRASDDLLYMAVVNSMGVNVTRISLCTFLKTRANGGIPSYESVSRCRRKAQREHPELLPNEDTKSARKHD